MSNMPTLLSGSRPSDNFRTAAGTPTTFDVALPRPHQKQAEILMHDAHFHVICAGRRAGKTTLAAMIAVLAFAQFKQVLITSPSQKQVDVFWQEIKVWLAGLIQAGVVYKHEGRRKLQITHPQTQDWGQIQCVTARDPDSLRSGKADVLIIDEAALFADGRVWYEVGMPMLLDTAGKAYIISTPRNKNWFYKLYMRGIQEMQKPDNYLWRVWHFKTYDNVHLWRNKRKLFQDIVNEIPIENRMQELDAKFQEGKGAVFSNLMSCLTLPCQKTQRGYRATILPPAHEVEMITIGADWANEQDYTVFSVFNATTQSQLEYVRVNQITFMEQKQILTDLMTQYQNLYPKADLRILSEGNSIGAPMFEDLYMAGMPIDRFMTTAQSKPPLIQAMVMEFLRETIKLLDDPIQYAEFESYAKKTTSSGHIQFSAPSGLHDDTVIAASLARHQFGAGIFGGIG